ncbi:interleukin-21 receptor [Sardina pilchardus]|uniref:interleukin-21 receptor n=1 Tax=Sardina pilchardus TaxID=27697 RepID=UPI002E0F118A
MGPLLCFLLLMTSLDSGLGQPGLDCYSDLVNNITCKLNGTDLLMEPQSKCIIKATDSLGRQQVKCDLKKPGGTFTECVLYFPHVTHFWLILTYDLEASCENKTVAHLKGFFPYEEKPSPPEMPTIENTTISWTHIRMQHMQRQNIKDTMRYNFELQYRTDRQSWKDGKSITLHDSPSRLLQEELKRGQRYRARVRYQARLIDANNFSTWSDWSPVASWDTPESIADPTEDLETWLIWWAVIGALAVIVFLVGIMFMGARKMKLSFIPDPAKYFDGLHSVHKGNFKTWLGSFQAVDVLSAEQLCEYTSPVEVLKGQMSSSFCNHPYFYGSQEIKKIPPLHLDNLEPCPEFSPYNDMKVDRGPSAVDDADVSNNSAGGTGSSSSGSGRTEVDRGPLQMSSSSYKDLTRLREEAQSPDSGVSVGSMDEESHEESLESGYEPDERAPLARRGGTLSAQKASGPWRMTNWSVAVAPLPPLSPLHCTVPFFGAGQGPEQCSTPTGLQGELAPSSDDYMPLQT